jgi:hypothetical protein
VATLSEHYRTRFSEQLRSNAGSLEEAKNQNFNQKMREFLLND